MKSFFTSSKLNIYMMLLYITKLKSAMDIVKNLFQVKTKALSVLVNRDLDSVDKNEISNLSPDSIYLKCP